MYNKESESTACEKRIERVNHLIIEGVEARAISAEKAYTDLACEYRKLKEDYEALKELYVKVSIENSRRMT